MGRPKTLVPAREPDEAWAMAVENTGLVMSELYRFLNTHHVAWYSGPELQAELESHAWEGMYQACLLWDENKGKLSTYAVPSIRHSLLRALDRLMRMGGNNKGGGKREGPLPDSPPKVYSLEAMTEAAKQKYDAEAFDSLGDFIPQPWQDQEDEEADLIDRLDDERLLSLIRELAEHMPEPHRTVFKTIMLSDHPARKGRSFTRGAMSMKKAVSILHKKDTTIQRLYLESIEWMRNQLSARGYEEELGWEELLETTATTPSTSSKATGGIVRTSQSLSLL